MKIQFVYQLIDLINCFCVFISGPHLFIVFRICIWIDIFDRAKLACIKDKYQMNYFVSEHIFFKHKETSCQNKCRRNFKSKLTQTVLIVIVVIFRIFDSNFKPDNLHYYMEVWLWLVRCKIHRFHI